MKELFTLTVILYLLSILAVLPLRKNYRASITVGHVFTGLASISLLAFTVMSLPEALKGKAIEFTYNLGVAEIPFHVDSLSLVLC
ncbi:MAG: hydantoin racemase, partial [Thermococcus sp.]